MNYHIKNIINGLLLLIIVSSCEKNNIEPIDNDINNNLNNINLELYSSSSSISDNSVKYYENIYYDEFQLTNFDFFKPNSELKTPLVIYIHGGGFQNGDKSFIEYGNFPDEIISLLNNKIAVASINYRLLGELCLEEIGVEKSLNDGLFALQFIKYHSDELNIDEHNIILSGQSAGAGIAQYISLKEHSDLTTNNLINRKSSKVKSILISEIQATYDVLNWDFDVFYNFPSVDYNYLLNITTEEYTSRFLGSCSLEEAENNYSNIDYKIDFIDWVDSSLPNIWLSQQYVSNTIPTSSNEVLHHPEHANVFINKCILENINKQIQFSIPEMNLMSPIYNSRLEFILNTID